MTIREEILKAGYSNKYVDEIVEEAYQQRIIPRKKFLDTKIGRIISFDLVEYLIHHYSLKLYERQRRQESELKRKELEEKGFQGDKHNGTEVLQYEQALNRQPISTINNGKNSFTHKYQDGLQVNVKVTLSGIFDSMTLEELEIRNKRLIADYLGLEEESIIGMEDSKLDRLIGYNEQLKRRQKNWHISNESQIHKLKQKQERLVKGR